MNKSSHQDLSKIYLVIGNTSLTPEFSVFLHGDGLKEIVKQMRKGEDLRITIGQKTLKWEIVDTHNRYESKPHDGSC